MNPLRTGCRVGALVALVSALALSIGCGCDHTNGYVVSGGDPNCCCTCVHRGFALSDQVDCYDDAGVIRCMNVPPGDMITCSSVYDRAKHASVIPLIRRLGDELRNHPTLLVPAAEVAASWSPAIEALRDGGPGQVVVSAEMTSSLVRLLDALAVTADDPALALEVARLRDVARPESAIGRPLDAILVELLATPLAKALEPGTALRLTGGERSLAADGETLLVPAAAHVGGAAGTRWRTDVTLTAVGGVPALAAIALLPRGQENSDPEWIQIGVESGHSLLLEDILESLFGFEGAAALRVSCASGSVIVTSRTYNLEGELGSPEARTFGQFLPALSARDAIVSGDQGRLLMLTHDPSLSRSQRTNLILVNGGARQIELEIELRTADGQTLGGITRALRAWEYRQEDRVFEQVTPDVVEGGYAVVRVTSPGGRLFALASVVDNLTGDPVAVPAVLRSPHEDTTPHETQVIQAAARIAGFADTDWRTDLVVHGLTDVWTNAQVALLPRGQENTLPETRSFQVLQGQSLEFEDVLQSLFDTEGAACLWVTPYGGAAAVASRTYNVLGEGNAGGYPAGATFGQFLGPVEWTQSIAFGEEGWIPHLSHDPSLTAGSRTNLGLVNTSPREIDVEVDLYQGDGTLLGSFTKTLRTWENVQISKVFERVTDAPVVGGYAVVRTTHPSGTFVAHASVVDNRTGDPIAVDAVAVRKPTAAGVVASGDMLTQVFEAGLAPDAVFELLRAAELQALLDTFAADNPDRVTRSPHGIEFDLGAGTVIGSLFASGRTSLEDATVSDGTTVTGSLTIGLDTAVDGQQPVADGLELGLDLARVGDEHMAGTVSVAASGLAKAASQLDGALEFDTRICEMYPIGGSITVTIGGEQRTLTFTDACDGSFQVDIPSARYFALSLPMDHCDGGKLTEWQVVHLIEEDGRLAVDPASPATVTGRRRFVATGMVASTEAQVRFAQKPWPDDAGERRVGGYRGRYQSVHGGPGYYTGSYGYTVADGDCRASYYHGRDDPSFEAGVLTECDGPCGTGGSP